MTFVQDLHLEAVLALGYAFFLLLVALGIEVGARLSHRHVRYSKTVGFRFHRQTRARECPEGKFLWLHEIDHDTRRVRYRAEARHCNQCGIKRTCTDSDEGRELTYSFEGWAESEMGRFHRGFCLMLVVLAGFVLAVAFARHLHGGLEQVMLGAALSLAVAAGFQVWSRLREPAAHAPPLPVPKR